jgi:hypothetical protein
VKSRGSVAVRILGHEYHVRSDGDPERIERVARAVDDAMARIRDRTGTADTLDLAILTALNFAHELLGRGATPEGGVDRVVLDRDRLRALAALAEEAAGASERD